MSTIKVNSIKNTSTDDGGIAIDNSGHVQIDGQQLPTAGPLSNRNLFINGEQKVDQRNAGSAVTLSSAAAFVTDRWSAKINGGAATGQRVTDVPSGKGFVKSFKFDVTTADTSLGSNDEIFVQHLIEAQNLSQLRYGTSEAQSITISFWVRSALTGDYGFYISELDAGRAYQTTYNISAADTWEYKTITIPGDTAGTINDDNGAGFEVRWYLGVGSNKAGSSNQNAWGTDASNRHPAGTNLMASTSNDWFITGCQLEVGEKATPFEHRSYGDELARCQRYYQRTSASSTAPYQRLLPFGHMVSSSAMRVVVELRPPMRAVPTYNQSTAISTSPSVGTPGLSLETNASSERLVTLIDNSSISGTQGDCISVFANNDASAFTEFVAEL